MTQDPSPHEALASIQAARTGVASVAAYPIGYDILYGAVCALLVAGPGLPQPWSAVATPIAMFALVGLVMWWRKKYGWWVSGVSPPRARWVAIGLGVVLFSLVLTTVRALPDGPSWLPFVTGGAAFVAAIVGNRLWMRVWRKELADGVQ
jgi:hypothetical protein